MGLCCAGIVMAACNGDTVRPMPTQPSPTQPSPSAPAPPVIPPGPVVREIKLSEVVQDRIERHDVPCMQRGGWPVPCRLFLLTAPADGTVVAKLSWDVDYSGMILMLRIDDTEFPNAGPPWTPQAARFKIAAGKSYRVAVGLAGTDWFGGSYVLTTSLE